MFHRSFPAILVCLCLSFPLPAQLSRDSKFDILRTVIADQASARIAMPFGTEGIELTESGEIKKEKLYGPHSNRHRFGYPDRAGRPGRQDEKSEGVEDRSPLHKKSSLGSEAGGAERNARGGFGFQQTQFPQDGHRCSPARVSGSGQSQGSSDRYGSQHRHHGARPPG